jgi:NAD(P)-dependent dehydrogenase (short-subunit alcohol dehydrogenase family)
VTAPDAPADATKGLVPVPVGRGLLDGKVMLIAGVGPSIGGAVARVAAREGASVAMLARRTDTSSRIADAIREGGGSALALRCDLGDDAAVQTAVDAVLAEWRRVDAVFYNAASYDHKNTDLDVDEAQWQRALDVNFGGAMTLTRAIVPSMLANGGGTFVYNSSGSSLQAEEVRPGYGISKSALNALMRFVAARHGREGIRANAILPFVYEGPGAEAMGAMNSLGRSGTADEIAEVVTFLCSDRASIVTGELIHLDGGMSTRATWPTR